MPTSWLLTSLQLGAFLISVVSAQDAVFVDATFPLTTSPNYGRVLRLCYPEDDLTDDIFMAATTNQATCEKYGGGDRWIFFPEETPASEKVSRRGTKAFVYPDTFDYFSLQAPDGRAIHFDSTPEALAGAEKFVLGNLGQPKIYSKAIFTTGHKKRLPRYGEERGHVFPGDSLQFIGSSARAVGYYKLLTTQNEDKSFSLLISITEPKGGGVLLTAVGDEEVVEDPESWVDRQSRDTTIGGAIGAGNVLPEIEGTYANEESSVLRPAVSRITETRHSRRPKKKKPAAVEQPQPANDIITTEFIEEYPPYEDFTSSNLLTESLGQAVDEEMIAAAQDDLQQPVLNQEGQVNSRSSLLEGADAISDEEMMALSQRNEAIGEIGDRSRTTPVVEEPDSEHEKIAAAVEAVQRSQDPLVGYNRDISEAELSGFFPGVSRDEADLSESLGLTTRRPAENKPADESFEDLRANTVNDVSAEDLTPSIDAGVIGVSRGQQSMISPPNLEVLTEQPNEVEDASPELAQWNDDVLAIEDDESVLSQPPGLGQQPRRASFEEIARQIGASTVSDGMDENEGAAAIIGDEESVIDTLPPLPLSSGMEVGLNLLNDLGGYASDLGLGINIDAQAFLESPRKISSNVNQAATLGDEGTVPYDLKPGRWGQKITGPTTESVPAIVPLIRPQNQEQQEIPAPELPSLDSMSRSRLSLSSSAYGLNQPLTAPRGRRQLRLANPPYNPAALVTDEQVQPRLLNQPEMTAIDTEEMPAQVLAPLLETDEPVNVIEQVVIEPEEEKVQTVNEISGEATNDEEELNITGRRLQPRRRRRAGQANEANTSISQPTEREPDFWETMAQDIGPARPSRNRASGAGWSQNFGPNGQGGKRNYERR
ncbi:hypothetical protein AOL_s00097g383 [Orbilia oligospora ATCC 24927]|uniref:Uncharacterized protein n=2 Tax=Orbilia oligospora TaxID=2813651 RepID=G1XJ56_ARTOA|nr:hypothetical protein AOL_s00097g383 [Orbilia oligospora ATCC 24927]EGX46957.1 hypothetical protein AOL_s00097g383 [Orbilia oligospora ATCC 24927]KAF3274907.1 hypothetical protein TWF970_007610 [Orbilia oligospora]